MEATPVRPAWSGKEAPMWVYDGEQWTEEGGSNTKPKPETVAIRIEEFLPELQILEIVQIPKTNPMPPFPLP
jgi:hypothetical protein